jgi:uncharacterized protein
MNDAATNVVRLADITPQSWKNGGGVTRELLAWPSVDDWIVRVSVADIERDGPFSPFPGVERHFAVLKGNGVRLFGVDEFRAGSSVARFEGEIAPYCELIDGPTRDLNVMIRRNFGSGMLKLGNQNELVMVQGATIHGIFDATAETLSWVDGKRALSIDSKQTQTGSLFHFAFWMNEALR